MQRTARLLAVAIFALALFTPVARAEGKKKIILIAGAPSHEWGGHEHNAGVLLLAKCLKESQLADQLDVVVFNSKKDDAGKWVTGWPKDPSAFDGAAAIVMYNDGGGGHPALAHLKEIDELAKKGVGIGMIHYAVEPGEKKDDPNNGHEEFLRWIGGYFDTFFSVNPHWKADVNALPNHPVANGVKPFTTNDEWYYHMRFRPEMKGVTPIIAAVPPDKTRTQVAEGKEDAHNGNNTVRAGVGKSLSEYMVWVSENPDPAYHDQRGFGCTGAHVHWNWAQDDFRKTVLNAIIWIAHVDVPKDGVDSKRPSVQDLLANMDPKTRKPEQDDAWVQKRIDELNK
jgi:hypothetical protein